MSNSIYWKIILPVMVLLLFAIGFLVSVKSEVIDIFSAVIVAAILFLLVEFLITRMITGPIKRITKAADSIAAGNLDQQIPIMTNDEIGRLARAFNEMSQNLQTTMANIVDERSNLATVLANLTDGVVMTNSEESILLVNSAAERLSISRNKRNRAYFNRSVARL